MATSCILCEQRSENAHDISFHTFPENEDHRKRWLDAIGKTNAEVPAKSSLCSRHFSQNCFINSSLIDNAVPTLQLEPYCSTEEDRPQENSETELFMPISRPTITKGRRIHMLSDEEMKNTQPIKYVRFLKSVNWDEISKVPAEAKIVWEVAMEELKEDNEKIKHLQAHVRQLNATILKLKNALKTRNKRKTKRSH
ncbi:THAP domain-containing protein 1-like [Nylanderia fulva]|uniref:THAP domain-containing protein 1-like n=1 Tax=Nylanderia fulva TaxID=613905 RepID=UPI0010FB66E3|nr:THAP domain-containing protein 1-like [Nylanderia fulva]